MERISDQLWVCASCPPTDPLCIGFHQQSIWSIVPIGLSGSLSFDSCFTAPSRDLPAGVCLSYGSEHTGNASLFMHSRQGKCLLTCNCGTTGWGSALPRHLSSPLLSLSPCHIPFMNWPSSICQSGFVLPAPAGRLLRVQLMR